MSRNVFILTPAYNAALTLEGVFSRFSPEVCRRVGRFVVVDDGSTDETWAVIERLRVAEPKLIALRHDRNLGYGAAQKTMLRYALACGAEVAAVVHADGQYAPESLPQMLEVFDRGEADLVQGSRMLGGGALKGGMPFYKWMANKCLTAIENLAFGMNMAEFHSGYMVYHRRMMEGIPFERLSDSFDFDLEMIVCARLRGYRIQEVAIPTRYADEDSHLNPVRYGMDVLAVVRRYCSGCYGRFLDEHDAKPHGPAVEGDAPG
jgi:glycosyltransferase involved in cell wall biosynthesis